MKKDKLLSNYEYIPNPDKQIKISSFYLTYAEEEVELQWNSNLIIIHIMEGEGIFTISGKDHKFHPGTIVIINPNQIYSAMAIEDRPVRGMIYQLTFDMLRNNHSDSIENHYLKPLSENDLSFPNIIIKTFPIHDTIVSLLISINEAYNKRNFGFELKIKRDIFDIMFTFFNNNFYYQTVKPSRNRKITTDMIVRTTIEYIANHFDEDISLDLLADICETTKPHLCRSFKRRTNQTITEYHNNYRINEVCRRLTDTNEQILKIAFDVGYNSIPHFNSRFKKKTSMTPKQYRLEM